ADDQQIGQRNIVKVHHLPHALAALIHERFGLREKDLVLPLDQLGELGVEAALTSAGMRALAQRVDDAVTDVMPRARIALAGIAEADDHFHGHVLGANYSASSSSAFGRPITSGSAAPGTSAAAAAGSGSATGAVTCTTIASGSVMTFTSGGNTKSRT